MSQLLARIDDQFPVTPGHARIVIEQAALPNGVPDLLEVHASASALRKLERRGLRLRTPREAAVLERLWAGRAVNGHDRSIRRQLENAGWLDSNIRPVRVSEAIAYEVKVRDWQAGIHQLTRYMKFTSRGVLALPFDASKRIPRRFLRASGVGLIAIHESRVSQLRKGRRRSLSRTAELWLGELAIRAVSSP